MKPLWRKCSVTFPAINFWVLGLRHNQTETRAGIAVLCRILAFVDTALGRRVGLHARISRGTGTRWSARNCRPYCGVALLLVRSTDKEDAMCYERDYKIFEDQKKAEDTRVVQERRAGLIDRLLNAANKPGEKTRPEGTPVKEVAPAK